MKDLHDAIMRLPCEPGSEYAAWALPIYQTGHRNACHAAAKLAMAAAERPAATGWRDGLSQDYSKKLGTWFADQPGARQQLREDMEKVADVEDADLTDDEIDAITKQQWGDMRGTPLASHRAVAREVLAAQKAKNEAP